MNYSSYGILSSIALSSIKLLYNIEYEWGRNEQSIQIEEVRIEWMISAVFWSQQENKLITPVILSVAYSNHEQYLKWNGIDKYHIKLFYRQRKK